DARPRFLLVDRRHARAARLGHVLAPLAVRRARRIAGPVRRGPPRRRVERRAPARAAAVVRLQRRAQGPDGAEDPPGPLALLSVRQSAIANRQTAATATQWP